MECVSPIVVLVGRAHRFSPNSVERDEAILAAVAEELRRAGREVVTVNEEELAGGSGGLRGGELVLSMARDRATLEWLAGLEDRGVRVVNSARALLGITRRGLLRAAREAGVDTAQFAICETEEEARELGRACPLPYPVWWKRDDRVSQEREDVVMVRNDAEWRMVTGRGVREYVVEGHVEGDLVKFYGVAGTAFFHWNYPQYSKFGKEAENGGVRGYDFDAMGLKRGADRLAEAVGMTVYGGDAVVREDGRVCVIDFNDWPSFSSCRAGAARAIASRVQSS